MVVFECCFPYSLRANVGQTRRLYVLSIGIDTSGMSAATKSGQGWGRGPLPLVTEHLGSQFLILSVPTMPPPQRNLMRSVHRFQEDMLEFLHPPTFLPPNFPAYYLSAL